MKKSTAKLIIVSVAILAAFNVALIGMLLVKKRESQRPNTKPVHQINQFIIDELKFDKQQSETFVRLSEQHHTRQSQNQDSFRTLKRELHKKMIEESTFDIDSAANVLADLTRVKETEFYLFFTEVMKICNAEQKQALQKVFFEATAPSHAKMPSGDNLPKGPRPPK